ncbi:MAG: tetratricopeptide repeat protein [Candidatus Competibacter sp.]
MATLIIRQVETSNPPQFSVMRLKDGKTTPPAPIVSPVSMPVKDLPDTSLSAGLRWYLEDFLDYPFPPVTDRAECVQAALRGWGEQAFTALFGAGQGRDFYHDAHREGLENLDLRIASDDPGVLAWPWEALADPQQAGALAHHCRIERQLDRGHDPLPLPEGLPRDGINILFVTARPYENDVRFRSLSRPVVEWIEQRGLPARVTILRPPTFERLREHLRERPAYYHIVHFDGHGGYGATGGGGGSSHLFRGAQGLLVFEDQNGNPDPVPADKLGALLREYRIPVMVLNACRSAMVDERAEDAFASVAASLLRAGIRSVAAMAYSLYVSGAEAFLPAFYRRLFEIGNMAEAMRAGRQAMLEKDGRVCARGRFPLEDWLVPVVYQQEPPDFSFACGGNRAVIKKPELPPEARDSENPYGFIGRDAALLQLERALRRPPAGILIHGLAGVGKTTLARGLVEWLAATEGLGEGCFWFTFNDILSSEFVFNRLVEALFGVNAMAADSAQKQAALVEAFRKRRFILVWDNFESATGVPGTTLEARLPEPDRQRLRDFLGTLRGGASKVIITSRSPETWLSADRCFPVNLGGLQGEERWEYCAIILRDLGMDADQQDDGLKKLMDELGGHPLAMRALLPRLRDVEAKVLAEQLKGRIPLDSGDDSQARLFAALEFVEDALPKELKPLLFPLGLHERFVDADDLERMTQQAESPFSRADIECLLVMLGASGLLRPLGQGIHEMHPALTGFLRARPFVGLNDSGRDVWRRAFVDVMGWLADHFAPKALHEQRVPFHWHSVNFLTALVEAEALGIDAGFAALTQALGSYALNQRDFASADRRFAALAKHHKQRNNPANEAVAYHQLGRIAQERRDFAAAEGWYRKSLAISEKHGNEHGAASTYHQLGMIAEERRDFAAAEQWYRKSLAISEKHGNEHGAASTYHQLGMIAEERRDFAAAEQWYRKSLAIKEKHGDEHGAASTYHQLGIIAEERRDFAAAERWYQKSRAIWEKHGDERGAASTYHQLGIIAQERRDFTVAERWYQKSLAIKEKHGNEHSAASTYHQLGRIAEEQRDFTAAERWYQKSLAIKEKHGNEHGAASIYHQLGRIAEERRDFTAAERWYQQSRAISEKQGNERGAASTYYQLGRIAEEQRDFTAAEGWYQKSLAISEKHDDERGTASIYHQLGIIAEERRDLAAAERWYQQSRAIWEKHDDEHGAAITYHQLGMIAQERRDLAAAERWYQKSLAISEKHGDEHGAAITYHQLGRIAEKRRDLAAAEGWYQQSLAIWEKHDDEHGAASTYLQLGILAGLRGHFVEFGRWLARAIVGFTRQQDPYYAEVAIDNFLIGYRQASLDDQAKLRQLWEEAKLGPFPKDENSP